MNKWSQNGLFSNIDSKIKGGRAMHGAIAVSPFILLYVVTL